MLEDQRIKLTGNLISGTDIGRELSVRKSDYEYESIGITKKDLLSHKLSEDWEVDKEYKTTVRIRKAKGVDVICEDRVWAMFASMGFKVMNKNRNFHLPYSDTQTQQIDIFAKDDETVLIVECKSSQKNKLGDFKKDLESMSGQIKGLIKSAKELFPGENLKFKYILATTNFAIGQQDIERLKKLNGAHLDEEAVKYYTELYKQLGLAARYQLLGALFYGMEIPEMDVEVPAVRGKMGNHTYYSFSIEPEKLLKIGYVLHRSKVNSELMPTYQRLVKKARIKAIKEFIDEKSGYFPNSVVINLDVQERQLRFERANTQVRTTLTSVGILHLPKKYRSAYIIDGQHRLYGYSDSKYKSTNSIPVVAFVDLDRNEQVKLFMEINENQKAVPKNLRITLNADLLWTSENFKDRQQALCSRIALRLGEDRRSPLFNMVSVGEDKRTITTDFIARALLSGNFIGKANNHKIEKLGTFYQGDLNKAYDKLSDYLFLCLSYIRENLETEWESKDTIIVINKGVMSLIRSLSDIVDHLLAMNLITLNSSSKDIFLESKRYLNAIVNFYKNISNESKEELRTKYGQGGETDYWRTLQKAIRSEVPKFQPLGLAEYEIVENKEYNEEAYKILRDIEQQLQSEFKKLLISNFGETWFEEGVPPQIQDETVQIAQQKKREKLKEIHPWECLRVIDYRYIALRNWQSIFQAFITLPDEQNIRGGKEAKTLWIDKMSRIRNQIMHSYYVSKEELDFLKKIKNYICK